MTASAEGDRDFWHDVARCATDALGGRFDIARRERRHGDGAASAWVLTDRTGRRVFVKTTLAARADHLLAERDGLEALARVAALRVPRVHACGRDDDMAYLLLEHLDLYPLDAAAGSRFGQALARLHADTGDSYGWHQANLIGASKQVNAVCDDWVEFWRERRLRVQLDRLQAAGADPRLLSLGASVVSDLSSLLDGHRPAASLLHGDLWAGNLAQDAAGLPVVFDPAVYRGDRETDLAMTTLFGGVPTQLAEAYAREWPLAAGHERRADLYNLYHVLNHAVLFGGGYQRMAMSIMNRLLGA